MYELVQVGKKSYYIQSPAKIGIYLANDNEVYLIDSGNDKDAGRKVKKILEQNNWHLKAILNTHSNADHIGGNHYLQQHYNCKIFAHGIESCFSRYPILEPAFLYGGYPFKDLKHKFLMAQSSDVRDFNDPDFPNEVEVILLPGHFFDMVGFRLPDDTVFLGDCLSSEITLNKYQLSFIYDVENYIKTLDKVARLQAKIFVPSHADASIDITELINTNKRKVFEIANQILELCQTPITFEPLLQKLFNIYQLTMTYEQYVLIGSTVRSYLSWLKDTGKINAYIENNTLLWKSVVTKIVISN